MCRKQQFYHYWLVFIINYSDQSEAAQDLKVRPTELQWGVTKLTIMLPNFSCHPEIQKPEEKHCTVFATLLASLRFSLCHFTAIAAPCCSSRFLTLIIILVLKFLLCRENSEGISTFITDSLQPEKKVMLISHYLCGGKIIIFKIWEGWLSLS